MMRDLDFCMLTTHAADGGLHARPMSNNGEVEFDGDVWFFSEDGHHVRSHATTVESRRGEVPLKWDRTHPATRQR